MSDAANVVTWVILAVVFVFFVAHIWVTWVREEFADKPPENPPPKKRPLPIGRYVSPDSFCPGCGNPGCDLTFVPGTIIDPGTGKPRPLTGDGEPKIQRKCKTCGAICFEPVVRPAKEWIGE